MAPGFHVLSLDGQATEASEPPQLGALNISSGTD